MSSSPNLSASTELARRRRSCRNHRVWRARLLAVLKARGIERDKAAPGPALLL
jgi:hypothetical protein